MQTSMQYTIGTALTRAHEDGKSVEVLVEGQWLAGRIIGSDSMGVVLEDGADHCIVRLERITAVRVAQAVEATGFAPGSHRSAAPGGPSAGAAPDARPMPGPRQTMLDVVNVVA